MKNIMAVLAVLLIALALTGAAKAEERLLIIDDDVGMLRSAVMRDGAYQYPWVKMTDPDGGLELLYALNAPGVRVLGVTCSMGCSTTDVCMESVRRILDLAGHPDIPVLRGANSPDDLGQPTDAARFIIDMVMANPGKVEIIATAPLTNIATALTLEPCLAKNWKALHVGTGEFMGALGEKSDARKFRFAGYQDLNINVDPEAARILLQSGADFFLYPNEIMDDASLTFADWRRLRRGNELARFVAHEISPFLTMGLTIGRLAGYQGLYLHGVIPLAVALEPGLAEPPLRGRVTMYHAKRGGWSFMLTADERIPERLIYTRLADPATVERRTMEAAMSGSGSAR